MSKTPKPSLWKKLLVVGAFIALIYFPIFLHLDTKTLREWDEARNGINAFEMSRSHDFVVKTYQGQPDLWETKPPLLVWLQVGFFKVFGYTELAIRLPSAIATFCLAMFLLYFFYRHFNKPFIGILSSLVLLSSSGYIHEHAARTGDHDALLICLEMMMLLSFFMYTERHKRNQLLLFSWFFVLAIYTKSIAVFMLFPGTLIYLVISGKFLPSIRDKKLWFGLLASLALAALYYWIRERAAPGYLKAVWENELFPRYFNTAKTYKYEVSDFWYYFRELKNSQFSYWLWFLLPAIIINFLTCKDLLRRFHLFLLVNAVVFFVVIAGGTNNIWYDLPLLPLFAMIIGIALFQAGRLLMERVKINPSLKYVLLFLALCLVFYKPYPSIIRKVMDRDETNPEVQYGYMFRQLEKQYPQIKKVFVYNPSGSNYPLVFYRDVLNATKGYEIKYMYREDLKNDGRYIVVLEHLLPEIEDSGIDYEIILQDNRCYLLRTIP